MGKSGIVIDRVAGSGGHLLRDLLGVVQQLDGGEQRPGASVPRGLGAVLQLLLPVPAQLAVLLLLLQHGSLSLAGLLAVLVVVDLHRRRRRLNQRVQAEVEVG